MTDGADASGSADAQPEPPPAGRDPLPLSAAGFRALAAALPQMITVTGPVGGVHYVSPKWLDFTGLDEAALLGNGLHSAIHPEDRAAIEERRRSSTGVGVEPMAPVEFRIQRHDGEWRRVESTLEYLRDDAGDVRWIIGSAYDVTDRRAEEYLARERQEQLRAAVTATGLARYAYYPGERKLVGDSRLSEIVGVSVEELMTRKGLKGVIGTIHPDDAPIVDAGIAAALAGGPDYDVTYRIDRPSGDGTVEERWLAARGVAEFDHGGPPRLVGIVEDITDRVHEEERRLQVQKREAIGTLASGIAHDFNNVLSAILSNASLAEVEAAAGDSTAESLAEIRRAALRAGDMVRRLLDASREEEPAAVPFDFGGVVEEACSLVGPTLPPSVTLRRSIPSDLPPLVGDATQLHQVTMNLVTNAGHATTDHGSIEVVVERLEGALPSGPGVAFSPGPYLALHVTDDGEGMSPSLLARVFDPFFTTKPAGEGTGLGLTVSQRIARNHGGDIRVRSELGAGTTVSVYLPVVGVADPSGAPETPGAEAAAPADGAGPIRVLFVDDELALVRLARRALPMAGFEVEAFDRPTAALDFVRADPACIDVLVTDLSMPNLTGLELIGHVRKLCPDLAVILSSGYLTPEDHLLGEQLGLDAIVPKPCSIGDLTAAIQRAVAARR